MRILLVEDSQRLQRSIGKALRHSGYAVDASGDGEAGLWLAESNDYDAIILDIMLPKLDGLDLLRRLRQKGRQTPILLLTARDGVEDRVTGLQTGADDYLVKPFALQELLARVQALCRRQYSSKSNSIVVANLEIDMTSRLAKRAGQLLDLTSREYMLLEYLALRRGQIVTRSEIETHIYGESTDLMSNAVDSAVCTLRKKLEKPRCPSLIHTKRGLGYMLGEPS
ncbi:MAG TPA: response regulator transcription factor [Candidatus Cybelea sp.]|jgi:DNA-binding response OmpR family regulator|nr:response regulator transcription factor [Candidatus Cybelea sp.]